MRHGFQLSKDVILAALYDALVSFAEHESVKAEDIHKIVSSDYSVGFVRRILRSLASDNLVEIDQYDDSSPAYYSLTDQGFQYVESVPPLRNILNLNENNRIPASNRIVSLDDNYVREIESAADELIAAIEPENSIDGDADERSRILAQIRAAKELLKATSIRAYLMYEALFHALNMLIDKYRDKALGQIAAKLLDLLIDHIFGGK